MNGLPTPKVMQLLSDQVLLSADARTPLPSNLADRAQPGDKSPTKDWNIKHS